MEERRSLEALRAAKKIAFAGFVLPSAAGLGTDPQFKKSRLNDDYDEMTNETNRFNTLFQPVEKCCRGEGEPKSGSDLPS